MILKAKRTNKIDIPLTLFMTFALMPDLVSIGGHSLKIMYFIFVYLVAMFLIGNKIRFPQIGLSVLFLFAFLVSSFASISWGLNRLLVNYCFGFVIIVLFLSIGEKCTEKDWMRGLQKVWIILVCCVAVNDIIQINKIFEYFQLRLDHPYISTLVTGGVNLEAAWISILTLSFFFERKRWIPLVVSLAFSMFYASRVGIIAWAIVFCIFVYGRLPLERLKTRFIRRTLVSILGVCVLCMIILLSLKGGVLLQVVSRFADIGQDPGSLGRLAMWKYVFPTVEKYPLGVGLGNAIAALETVSPYKYTEDNLHNIYMQMFVELGIVGGLAYLAFVAYFIVTNIKRVFSSPIVGMLLIYFFLCLFQFRGGETIFFCLIGIFLCIKNSCNKRKLPTSSK